MHPPDPLAKGSLVITMLCLSEQDLSRYSGQRLSYHVSRPSFLDDTPCLADERYEQTGQTLSFAEVSVLPFPRRIIPSATVNQLRSQSINYKARECYSFEMECGYGNPVIPVLPSFSLFSLTIPGERDVGEFFMVHRALGKDEIRPFSTLHIFQLP